MTPTRSTVLLPALFAAVVAPHAAWSASSNAPVDFDFLIGDARSSIGLRYEGPNSAEFTVGTVNDSWSDSERWDLYFRTAIFEMRHEPFFEASIFFEDRAWSAVDSTSVTGSIDYETFGMAFTGGTTIHLLPNARSRRIHIGLTPWVRCGMGGMDIILRDVPYSSGTYLTGNVGTGRLDFGAGIDANLTLLNRIIVTLGVGVDYWTAANITVIAGPSGGAVGISNATVDVNGHDVFSRVGFGIEF